LLEQRVHTHVQNLPILLLKVLGEQRFVCRGVCHYCIVSLAAFAWCMAARSRSLSPVELMEACLARIEQVNPNEAPS
jgi:hypothetical protein